jgi:predicted 2-oxoglutarate/Fe(II)-dependent dioxygenase YbiX
MEIKRIVPYAASALKTFALKNPVQSNPYVLIDNFLSEEEIDEFDRYLRNTYTRPSTVDDTSQYHTIKDLRFSSAYCDSNKFDDIIYDRVMELNRNVFKFDISTMTQARYTTYNPGDQIPWHTDEYIFPTSDYPIGHLSQRKLTAILMLSDRGDFLGGKFSIMVPGADPAYAIHTLELDRGSLIMYPAFTSHMVSPVTSGQRRNVVYRFNGPQWK